MLKVYNTLTRQKETFRPIREDTVTMYSCGPTVYNYAHIGNLRTYIFMDIVRRVLAYDGYKLEGVMNITDVGHLLSDGDDGEDKMVKASREQKKTPEEIAAYYTEIFMRDTKKLNIEMPEIIAKATEHIGDMIDYVKVLCEKGYAYETSDAIYFDISKFPEYGKLSRCNLEEQQAGARVEVNSEKKHPADFALWKKAEPQHIMQWDSPWGKGYPGWHIECSAMSKKYLGNRFDIHTGGVDHIPIHHENEIAQSEAYSGGKTVDYWLHGEFMLVDGGKMSKSLANTYTVDDLQEKGFSPMTFRYFCLNTHYRKKLNFTFEALSGAKTAYQRLTCAVAEHKYAKESDVDLSAFFKQFQDAIDDDFNLPLALGVLWTMVKLPANKTVYWAIVKMDEVFALSLDKAEKTQEEEFVEIPREVCELAALRAEKKKAKDYAGADAIRAKITELGFTLIDTKDGYQIRKNNS